MYAYIPTNIGAIQKNLSLNHDASFAFIVRTADALELLKWLLLGCFFDGLAKIMTVL
ncbi:unnamed protein product, partial [Strongylus vulgaris]